MEDESKVIGNIFDMANPGHRDKHPDRPPVVVPPISNIEGTPIWVDSTGREIKASDFWEMSKYCNEMTQQLLGLFVAFQEQFKAGALAFARMAEILETAQQRDTRPVQNIFNDNPPDDPGPTTPKPN